MKLFSFLSLLAIPLFSILVITGCGTENLNDNDSLNFTPTLRMSEEDEEQMGMDVADIIKEQSLALIPLAPSNLHVISQIPAPYYNSITLGWTDNSSNEQGFKIYRAECYLCRCGEDLNWGLVGSTSSGVVSFKFNDAKSTNPYFPCHAYVVAAYNSSGSKISNRVSVAMK